MEYEITTTNLMKEDLYEFFDKEKVDKMTDEDLRTFERKLEEGITNESFVEDVLWIGTHDFKLK